MARLDLSDREWSIIAPLPPNKPRGVPRTDDPLLLQAQAFRHIATRFDKLARNVLAAAALASREAPDPRL